MSEPTLKIRLGRPDDASVMAVLIRRVARRWILPDQSHEAGQAFISRISAKELRGRMLQGQRFYLGYLGDVLVGVSGMRDDSHLVHLFVGTRYQGRGIAGRLWRRTMQDAMRRAGTRRFTLNATRCGVPVYLRLGFRATGPEQLAHHGLLVTPMKMILPAAGSKRA